MKLFRRKSHGWEKLDEKKIDNHGIGRQRGRNPRRIMTNRLSARIRSFLSCFRPFVCYQELREDWLHDAEPLKDGIPFYCKWLGTCQVFEAQGTGCTDAAVRKIVDDTKRIKSSRGAESKLQKVLVVVSSKTLRIEDMDTKALKTEIPIYRISYCTADPNYPKVFAFIAREKGTKILRAHALLCNKESMAKAISLTVADAFSSAYGDMENQNRAKMTESLQEMSSTESTPTKPVSLLKLSQSTSVEHSNLQVQDSESDLSIDTKNGNDMTISTRNENDVLMATKNENDIAKATSNPFSNDSKMDVGTNPFISVDRRVSPHKRPLSEYYINAPHIKITGDEFLAVASSSSNSCSSNNMKALDLACPVDDDFEDEFTRLAQGRSNSNIFETPVRRSDLDDDINTLLANENTARDLANSQSTEDLLF